MISIGSHAAQSEEDQRFQRADILMIFPDISDVIFFCGSIDRISFRLYFLCQFAHIVFMEIHICDRCKKSFQHESVRLFRRCLFIYCAGKTNQSVCECILRICSATFFATDAGISFTAGIVSGLLALKTKHFIHRLSSFLCSII